MTKKPRSKEVKITVGGNVSDSTIIIGNENSVQHLQNKKSDVPTIDEIMDVVRLSSPADWEVNSSLDAEIAICKNNLSLRIETRHTDEFIHNDDFHEKWANKFLDPHARSYYYHLYYGATRLKEFILVSVDGGRALLPLPRSSVDLSVELIRYKIALIFDRFDTCDEYMRQAGLYLELKK